MGERKKATRINPAYGIRFQKYNISVPKSKVSISSPFFVIEAFNMQGSFVRKADVPTKLKLPFVLASNFYNPWSLVCQSLRDSG